jgi:hypothetical protein
MGVYRLKRFSEPEALKRVDQDLLLELLLPHSVFFEERGLKLSKGMQSGEIDYERLVNILTTPDDGVPDGLIHALYFIHEMSSPVAMDELIDAARLRGIELLGVDEKSPEDLAIEIWLKAPEIVERKHAETSVAKKRTYSYFQANVRAEESPKAKQPGDRTIHRLESQLGEWFEQHGRGQGCRIRASLGDGEVWYLIWHGQTLHREGTVKAGRSSSVVFRPERYDVAVYSSKVGEIRIRADSDREIQEYRRLFGLCVFGDEDFFPGEEKYTLEPLRTTGSSALVCQEIDGMKKVLLKEVRFAWDGGHQAIEILQASDVFAALRANERSIPDGARLVLAKFQVWFDGAKNARTVTVRPPNISSYTRDSDSSPVEEWLARRGFLLRHGSGSGAAR